MRKLLLLTTLLSLAMPASAVEVSRSKVDHPALGSAGGSALHTQIEAIYEKLGDNANSRYNEFSTVADSTTVEVDHNFGVNLDQLNVLIYSGSGANLTRITDPESQAPPWTIQEKTGSEKTIIEVITPSSGGPHTFTVITIHGKGSEKLNDLTDVDIVTTPPEDGQALVYDANNTEWIAGASGDASFKIQSVSDPNATIKGGGYDVSPGRQVATYDGVGSTATDFRGDLSCDLDTILGGNPSDDTTYILYIDLNSVGDSPITTTDSGEKLYPVECGDLVLLTAFPDDPSILGSRYVHVGTIHSADTGNVWSGTGSAFETFFFRDHDRPIINTSPVVYSLGEQAIGSVGSSGQIAGGHTLQADSFSFSLAADAGSFWNLNADVNDDSVNSNNLTALGTAGFTATDIFGTASNAGRLAGAALDIFQLGGGFIDPLDTVSSITVGGWFRFIDATPSSLGMLISHVRNDSVPFVTLNVETNGDLTVKSNLDTAITYSPGFSDGEWHHIVLTQTNKNYRLFIDGSLAATGIANGNTTAGTSFIGFGGDANSGSSNYDCDVQDLVLIKSVLSDEDVRKLASYKIDHNQNVATSDQNWVATFSGGLANQLDNGWLIDKSSNSVWFDFLDLASTDLVSLKLKNENATSHVIPLKTFDTGLLSSAPSFPLSHGLGSVPTAVAVIHEGQTTAGDFDSVKHLCSWDDTQITCAGLNTVDGTHRLRLVLSAANVAASITEATATDSGIVTTGSQTFGGEKTFEGNVVIGDSDTVSAAKVTIESSASNSTGGIKFLANGTTDQAVTIQEAGAGNGHIEIFDNGVSRVSIDSTTGAFTSGEIKLFDTGGTFRTTVNGVGQFIGSSSVPQVLLNDTDGVNEDMVVVQNAGSSYGKFGTTSANEGGVSITGGTGRGIGLIVDNTSTVLWADASNDDVELKVPTNGVCDNDVTGGNICSGTFSPSITCLGGNNCTSASISGGEHFTRIGDKFIMGMTITIDLSAASGYATVSNLPTGLAGNVSNCWGSASEGNDPSVSASLVCEIRDESTTSFRFACKEVTLNANPSNATLDFMLMCTI